MHHGKKLCGPTTTFVNKASGVKRTKKWCPIDGCSKVVVRLDKHLQKAHNIKPGTVA